MDDSARIASLEARVAALEAAAPAPKGAKKSRASAGRTLSPPKNAKRYKDH